jgi:ABC-type branched-subunit amino acid transport system ATPase component
VRRKSGLETLSFVKLLERRTSWPEPNTIDQRRLELAGAGYGADALLPDEMMAGLNSQRV